MKLFQTGNIEVVKCCQFYFGFKLPSVVHNRRASKFDKRYRNHPNLFCQPCMNILVWHFFVCQLSVIVAIHYGRCWAHSMGP